MIWNCSVTLQSTYVCSVQVQGFSPPSTHDIFPSSRLVQYNRKHPMYFTRPSWSRSLFFRGDTQRYSHRNPHPSYSSLPSWIARIFARSARPTGPSPCSSSGCPGGNTSRPSNPIRHIPATIAAVPTQNTSRRVPSADQRMRSCIVKVRSVGCRRVPVAWTPAEDPDTMQA